MVLILSQILISTWKKEGDVSAAARHLGPWILSRVVLTLWPELWTHFPCADGRGRRGPVMRAWGTRGHRMGWATGSLAWRSPPGAADPNYIWRSCYWTHLTDVQEQPRKRRILQTRTVSPRLSGRRALPGPSPQPDALFTCALNTSRALSPGAAEEMHTYPFRAGHGCLRPNQHDPFCQGFVFLFWWGEVFIYF